MFENREDFRLVLGTAVSPIGARIGEQVGIEKRLKNLKLKKLIQFETLVVIDDDNDEPTVGFEKSVYEVVETLGGALCGN